MVITGASEPSPLLDRMLRLMMRKLMPWATP
jgi:hypothetical protein